MITRHQMQGIIDALIRMRNGATDEQALDAIALYPAWKPDKNYTVDGLRYSYDGDLYRIRQAHTSQVQYPPPLVPALYEKVSVGHSGTIDDPIPFEQGMAVTNGLYYTQDDILYHCIRDSGNPLYYDLSALIGLYVEIV